MSSDAGNLVRGLETLTVGRRPTNVTRAYTLLRWRQDYTNKLVNHKKVILIMTMGNGQLLKLR